jgi:muramidase (phage lysozyme)
MGDLLKENWKYILAALATPALVMVFTNKLKAQTAPKSNASNNLRAFLTMIQYAEGTYGKNAYRMLFGGQLFNSYEKHPQIAVTKSGITSTAAGAYQILFRTWQSVQQGLGLADFTPQSQDMAAVELIRRRGALEAALAGRFDEAVYKCRKEWASLPGAGYGQNERSLASLVQVYQYAGGEIAA